MDMLQVVTRESVLTRLADRAHRLARQLRMPECEAVGRGGVCRRIDKHGACRALKEARRKPGCRLAPAHVPELRLQLAVSQGSEACTLY